MTQARPNWRTRYENLLASSTKKAADQEDEFLRVEQELELKIAELSALSEQFISLEREYHSARRDARRANAMYEREARNHDRALRVMDQLMGRQGTDQEAY